MSGRLNNFRRERFLRYVDPTYGLPDTDELPRSGKSFAKAYEEIEPADLSAGVGVDDVMAEHAERLETELYGAWRAGYDYLHVLSHLNMKGPGRLDPFYISQVFLPSHNAEPIVPSDATVQESFDLTSVPRSVMRAWWRDELPESHIRIDE